MYQIRIAEPKDRIEVVAILREVKDAIPLNLDNNERSNAAIIGLVSECLGSGVSLVAIDVADLIVGFQLSRRERILIDHEVEIGISLEYGAVTERALGNRLLQTMIRKTMALGFPLRSVVKWSNGSRMQERLLRLGFAKTDVDLHFKQDEFQWLPPGRATGY